MDRFRMLPNYQYHNSDIGVLETRCGKPLRDYQIYGNSIQDGEPSPDNPIEIESVGNKTANLFDIEKFVTLEGNSNYYKIENGNLVQVKSDYRANTELPTVMTLEPGTYYRSGYTGNAATCRWVNKNTATGIVLNPFTLTEATEIAVKWWASAGTILGSPMVNVGEDALPFEPFGKYKIPIEVNDEIYNIFLDEPLRKIGNYEDYIDFRNGKVIRNTKSISFKGNEGIGVPGTAINGHTPFRHVYSTGVKITYPFICNYLPYVNSNYSAVSGQECIARYYANGNQMFFIISNDRIPLNDTTAFKNWLKQLNAEGNPLTVYSCLVTSIEEDIELPKPLLNKGTNIIKVKTATQPSQVNWQYYK